MVGLLPREIDYHIGDQPEPSPEPEPEPIPEPEYAVVWSQNGKPVNTRKGPDETYGLSKAGKIPVGATVKVLKTQINSQGETWCRIRWTDPRGATWICWLKADFLKPVEPGPEPDPKPSQLFTVHIPYLTEYQADALIHQYNGSWKTKEGE